MLLKGYFLTDVFLSKCIKCNLDVYSHFELFKTNINGEFIENNKCDLDFFCDRCGYKWQEKMINFEHNTEQKETILKYLSKNN